MFRKVALNNSIYSDAIASLFGVPVATKLLFPCCIIESCANSTYHRVAIRFSPFAFHSLQLGILSGCILANRRRLWILHGFFVFFLAELGPSMTRAFSF